MSEERNGIDALFDRRLDFPDRDAQRRLSRLVGIEDAKIRLTKLLGILVNPSGPRDWAKRFHPDANLVLDHLERRPPLVILAGDVGTGKTELAETVGDAVARQEDIAVTLYPLSLATRGSGRVGEMTQLISAAFEEVFRAARKLKRPNGKALGAIVLLIDEGDALAQSRESAQMHHEDRAGVNALIRGVNLLGEQRLPAVAILCTNRLSSIDPAVQRRAAEVFQFNRPNATQRQSVLEEPLRELGFTKTQIDKIVEATGAGIGFTFSDLTQRFLPTLVIDAYPTTRVNFERAINLLDEIKPTPAFKDGKGG